MTEKLPESKTPSPDTTNVLTALSSNDGSLTLTINVDKSTAVKAAWWLIALIVSLFAVLLAVVYFLGQNSQTLNQAVRESRLQSAALDEKRMENRMAWKQLGVDGLSMEDHDISDILKQVRKKYPLKEE